MLLVPSVPYGRITRVRGAGGGVVAIVRKWLVTVADQGPGQRWVAIVGRRQAAVKSSGKSAGLLSMRSQPSDVTRQLTDHVISCVTSNSITTEPRRTREIAKV